MARMRIVEITVGMFVAAGLAALLVLAMQVSNLSVNTFTGDSGYEVGARFNNIGGLKVRAPVTIAGVRVGRVARIGFDEDTYQAMVHMRIDSAYTRLPEDTSASIYTSGLLGEQYVSLLPGGSDEYLKQGSLITLTQSALVLENLIGQYLFRQIPQGEETK
jgi:ABC-type transport system involved in resistance to organic solvents, periplasmic component